MKSTGVLGNKTSPSLATKRLIAVFLVAVLVVFIYGQMTKVSSVADARRTVIFMGGEGLDTRTASQPMSGSYHVSWKTTGFCTYRADLNGINVFSADSPTRGSKNFYSLPSTAYHMHMIKSSALDCEWQVSFTPA